MAARTPRTQKEQDQAAEADHFAKHLQKAYGTESHAKTVNCLNLSQVVSDYEPLKFSSFRVFSSVQYTILQDSVLFVEQGFNTLIFIAFAVPVYLYFNQEMDSVNTGGASLRKWIDKQEGRMREFAMIMTVLASLLLSFYTAMAVARWWTIRSAGVGGIKKAAMELEMLISQAVTQEPQVLDAIRRYARTSLVLVFLWRRGLLKEIKQELVNQGLLTDQEAAQLLKWNHCLHETIWGWQSAIVCMLWKEGKIHSDQLLRTLLERCSEGRKAIQCIHTHLAVKIPMQYVHLLGFLVKLHNVTLSVIMGSLFGAAVRNAEIIICCQLAGRTLILPLLFNAILLINAELSDPFHGDEADFPGIIYQNALEKDCHSLIEATQNMPRWLAKRYEAEP